MHLIPIDFKYSNFIAAKDSKIYSPLPIHRVDGPDGKIICCFHLPILERLKLFFTGNLYVSQFTFNRGLSPIIVTTHNTVPESYLPIDQIKVDTKTARYHSRIEIGQNIKHNILEGVYQIYNYRGLDSLVIRNKRGFTHVVKKSECLYFIKDLENNIISKEIIHTPEYEN